MFGRIPLAELILDDAVVNFNRAMLWIDSDHRWRLEIDTADTQSIVPIRPQTTSTLKRATMVTAGGDEIRGEVRINHRRLFPFRHTAVLLEGAKPLEDVNLDALAWND